MLNKIKNILDKYKTNTMFPEFRGNNIMTPIKYHGGLPHYVW